MSSIVSLRPPPSVSTNQANDFFWMSIRFGTSTDLSRRANVRRVRGASTEAKAATPREGRRTAGQVVPNVQKAEARRAKIAATSSPRQGDAPSSWTRPAPAPVCGGKGGVDEYDSLPLGNNLPRAVKDQGHRRGAARPARRCLRPVANQRWASTLITTPCGSRTKKRRTPHGSSTGP